MTDLKIALAGNPNAGKTSVFNALTGSHQHVGNYPGITVEKRWGSFELGDARAQIVDLPGTYSLTSFSPEERIARDELLGGQHDVVVVVADSTALQRSLVLLAQVMQLGATPVLCLNMSDEAEEAGQRLDHDGDGGKLRRSIPRRWRYFFNIFKQLAFVQGFPREWCEVALRRCRGNLELAINFCFERKLRSQNRTPVS